MDINLNYDERDTHKIFKFGGGEIQVKLNVDWILSSDNYFNTSQFDIICTVRNSDDIMKILLMKDAVDRFMAKNTLKFRNSSINLHIPYLPYARQDRVCEEGEAFSLKVFANLINSAKFDNVYVRDVHSDVGPALIDNCTNLTVENIVFDAFKYIIEKSPLPIIVSPDAGANKRVTKIYSYLSKYYSLADLVKCDKTRDTSTGKITSFDVFANDLGGATCLIVDDICSYGGTFKGLAKELKAKNAGDIYLYVTHYEGVADVESLKDAGIKEVITYKGSLYDKNDTDFIKKI